MSEPSIPDEAIEAAARALAHNAHSRAFDRERINARPYDGVRAAYRDDARAALTAAGAFLPETVPCLGDTPHTAHAFDLGAREATYWCPGVADG